MKSIPYGYKVEAYEPIDDRLVLTKAQMATAHEDMSLPDNYFAFCLDDNQWYEYSYAREEAGDLDPETGYYRLVPSGLVNDVLVNGVSVVEDKIAKVNVIEDVKVDGSSVVEDHIANIDFSDKQDKLTQGRHIKIENDVISVDGIEPLQMGYGLQEQDGEVSIDPNVVPSVADIPLNTSDLNNDSGFITKAVLNLENYYLKSEIYTQQEVNDLLSTFAGGLKLEVVATLPITGDTTTIYLVRRSIDSNIYDQYVWFNNSWVQVGSTEVDLSQYYTKAEVDQLLATDLAGKQDRLTNGAGIALNNGFIAVDMGDTLTTTGNKLDVKLATTSQRGVVSFDDNTIKMNAGGQLYATGGGGGRSYVAGPNIQISGNVISATDTKYTAGDAVSIDTSTAQPTINVLYDNDLIRLNRRGELTMDAVGLDTGDGIEITRDGVLKIVPNEVADAIDLSDYQKKLNAGSGIIIDQTTNTISATGGGGGGGDAVWGAISGTMSNQIDLMGALNNKQKKLFPGTGITITDLSDTAAQISATGGSSNPAFSAITGSPYDNTQLAAALNGKRGINDPIPSSAISGLAPVATSGNYNDLSNKPTIPNVYNSTITINQGGTYKGSFSLNQENGSVINLDAGGGGGTTPGNGTLSLYKNTETTANRIAQFTANQTSNTSAIIKIPTFSYNTSTGVLTITDN